MSAWINHVKKFAKKHNIKYGEALGNTECRKEYKNGKPIVGGEQEQKQEEGVYKEQENQEEPVYKEENQKEEQDGGKRRRRSSRNFNLKFNGKKFGRTLRKDVNILRKGANKMTSRFTRKSKSSKGWFGF
jgi:hypothetical protein